MMKIKFRAWDATYFEMFQIHSLGNNRLDDCLNFIVNGKEFPIMQYTGLKDKNGKDIYEGDIIKGDPNMAVTYSGDQNEGLGMRVGWYLQRDDFEAFMDLESRCNFNKDNYEVIGNIYENPELLVSPQPLPQPIEHRDRDNHSQKNLYDKEASVKISKVPE